MLIRVPARFETYGAVRIYDVGRVVSLDAVGFEKRHGVFNLDSTTLENVAESTAIVVAVRDEDPDVLDGVIKAVPLYSPLIIVSASSRYPVDMYSHEVSLAKNLYSITGRKVVLIHQRDPVLTDLLQGTSLEGIIDPSDGLVRYGKGEGIVLGVLAADAIGARHVGFIDGDNYIPGAVHEYTWIYYTGLSFLRTKYKMIRVVWSYKGGLKEEYFRKSGRVSSQVNNILNQALSMIRRFETDIVKSCNSGEHAMSIDLAKGMSFAGSFAVETYELIELLEECYLGINDGLCKFAPSNVEILQVESRNPHIHSEKGEAHLIKMLAESLGTIYHSKLSNDRLREHIKKILESYLYEAEPPEPRKYSVSGISTRKIFNELISRSDLAEAFGV
ncbi:MAG: mannosyl-3-phosphoglycerate synthase [Desulfurococcaceae archaeon]